MEHSSFFNIENKHEPSNKSTVEGPQNCLVEDDRYLQHSVHLLTLFPKEVWTYICSFLDSDDFLSLNNSSPFFRQTFIRQRVLVLYKSVLDILLAKLGNKCSYYTTGYYIQCPCDVCSVRTLILTNSRLVCRTWQKIIDKQACIWNGGNSQSNGIIHHHIAKNYTFICDSYLDKFLAKFNITHPSSVNPFIGKYISLHFRASYVAEFLIFAAKASMILEKYGKHLSTFEINLSFNSRNIPEHHQKVIEWLNHAPNLQNLTIQYKIPLHSNTVHNVLPVQVEQLPPQLKCLKKLVLKTYRPNISDDRMSSWGWLERYNLSQLVQVQDSLEFLKIIMVNKSDFQLLEKVKSPLKTLLACYICKEDDIDLSGMCTTLSEKFSNSLENLMVKFRRSVNSRVQMNIIRDSFYGRLCLPKVRKFDMRILNPCCLDFLLGMHDNLEELEIKGVSWKYNYKDFSVVEKREIDLFKKDQVVKYLGSEDNILQSNIWSIFPKLRKISMNTNGKCQELFREDWLKLQSVT